jgi:hypothetical protein
MGGDCMLCKNNPNKTCVRGDHFDGAYADSQVRPGGGGGKRCVCAMWLSKAACQAACPGVQPPAYAVTLLLLMCCGATQAASCATLSHPVLAYLLQVLRAKCEAEIGVELYNRVTGQPASVSGVTVLVRQGGVGWGGVGGGAGVGGAAAGAAEANSSGAGQRQKQQQARQLGEVAEADLARTPNASCPGGGGAMLYEQRHHLPAAPHPADSHLCARMCFVLM